MQKLTLAGYISNHKSSIFNFMEDEHYCD
jgi:hypothetical protein